MKGCEIFLSHTHWDMGWYLPFQVFRSRLANMMEQLLKLLDEFPEFRFTLDGQVVALEDYLEVEKDKHRIEKLFSMIRNGRISVGPFYVLPDEFLISGETFVRNFLVAQNSLLSVEPRDLILSTFKVAEDGKGVIVRLYNVGNSEVEGIINLGWTPTEIFLTNIAEKPLKKIEPRGNTIRLKVNAKETVTLKIV